MKVHVLKEFPYSPHGYDNAVAHVGEQELPDHIAEIALREKWAERVKAKKSEEK
jgi:hypothetical protein